MGAVGQLVLTVTSAAVGGVLGGITGAAFGLTIGTLVGSYLFPVKESTTVHGPRLDKLQLQHSGYGAVLPKVMGRMRITGIVIWLKIYEERVEHTTEVGGGKGGGGGETEVTTVEYLYYASIAIALCQGPISGVYKIWGDGKLFYNTDTQDQETLRESSKVPVTFYYGDESQQPPSLIEAHEGTGNVPGYRGVALAVFNRLPLKKFANRIPVFTFEVQA